MSVSTEIWKKINWERKGLRLPAVGCRAARLLATGLFATRLSVILGLAGQERHRSGAACNPIRAATVRRCEEIKTAEKRHFSTDGALIRSPTTRSAGPPDDFVSPYAVEFSVFGNSSQLLTVAAPPDQVYSGEF